MAPGRANSPILPEVWPHSFPIPHCDGGEGKGPRKILCGFLALFAGRCRKARKRKPLTGICRLGDNEMADDSPDWKQKPRIVGLLIFFCPPLGFYLLWKHPTWQKQTKWIVTGCYAIFVIVASGVSEKDKPGIGKEQVASVAQSLPAKATRTAPTTPEGPKIIAVAGAEPDRKKWEAASRPNALSFSDRKVSDRIAVFKSIVKKLKESPDRLASEKQEEKFRGELQRLIDEFRRIPFNGSYQTEDAKTIIELWEAEIENKYKGGQYLQLKDEVANIFQQYRSRPD